MGDSFAVCHIKKMYPKGKLRVHIFYVAAKNIAEVRL